MREELKRKGKLNLGMIIAYLYILLPIALFLIGWCRWYIWIPGILVVGLSFFLMARDSKCFAKIECNREVIERWIFIILIILAWVALSGIGRLVYQNQDHEVRNGIFELLVNEKWPIIRQYDAGESHTLRAHIYYIGFWLPAAAFGKLFGVEAGYYFQIFWATLGIALMYYIICLVQKKVEIWPLVVFIFFSGLDTIGYRIFGGVDTLWSNESIEWWAEYFQYSSNTTQLFWVFNQSIPAWITFMILYIQKNNKYILLILSTLLLSSTFPFVGMIGYALWFIVRNTVRNHTDKSYFLSLVRSICTIPNIVGGGMIGGITSLYIKETDVVKHLLSNLGSGLKETVYAASTQIEGTVSNLGGDKRGFYLILLVFLLIEVWVYCFLIHKYQNRRVGYWITVITLCVCPLIKVGAHSDFCMRASIPALQMLYLMVVDTIARSRRKKDYFTMIGLSILLIIGAYTPLHEMQRTLSLTKVCYTSGLNYDLENCSEDYLFSGDYVSGAAENNFFFDHIAKKVQKQE